jgi:hypothetical protein
MKRLSGLTCEPLTVHLSGEKWILSLPDSHASLSHALESVKEPGMSATFGPTFQGSLAKFDHQSSSWKTFQESLMTQDLVSLSTCPKWGMISRGELFALQKPAHLTEERDSLGLASFPTPTAKANQMAPSSLRKGGSFRNLLPTPDANPQGYRFKGDSQQSRGLVALAFLGKLEGMKEPGRLNPEFVEWLMGWPIGWTGFEHVETESCHIKRNSQSESS